MPTPTPRLLTLTQAAAYLGRNKSWFAARVPLFAKAALRWETKSDPLYDKKRLDEIIDAKFKEESNGA
jgi:hypothetical protein